MHILLIHQAFAALDEPGGTRHHELARYLVKLGHQVTIIGSPVSYLTGTAPGQRVPWAEHQSGGAGITVIRSYTYPALHRSFVHRVVSFLSFMISSFFNGLQVKNVDLVWGTSPPIFQGITAWLLARLKRVPFLFEVRDLWPAFAVEVGVLTQPQLIRASAWLERFLYQHADQLIVNSPGFVEHVRARGAGGVELLPNGADTAMFDPHADGTLLKQEWKLSGRFIALYAGAHGISNDLGVLLQAADRLRSHPEIAFVLLGDGKEKLALQAMAAEMNLPNVTFLSPLPKNEIAAALAAADACIAILKPLPLYATVYPNKVFDYMAAGRPVVLAIDGVIREVVEESAAGIYVPPGDPLGLAEAILFLATHQPEASEMGLRGRRIVKDRFDRPVLAARLARLMEHMVNTV